MLEDKLRKHFRLLPPQEKALKKLGIETIRDLLYHFPSRYADAATTSVIKDLKKGDNVAVMGKISGLKTTKAFHKKIPMAEGYLSDETGRIKITWFHQAYLAKMLKEDTPVRLEGRVSERKGGLYFSNPKVEEIPTLFNKQASGRNIYPIYPESRGVTSNWFYHKIQQVLRSGALKNLEDPIPPHILKRYNLPSLEASLVSVHAPRTQDHAVAARKRFSFEEIFFIQLERQKTRYSLSSMKAYKIENEFKNLDPLIERFPFSPTKSQERVTKDVLKDFQSGHPMSRLLEGDVGSGKTAVAAAATYAVVTSKPFDLAQGKPQNFGTLQVAYMAPTEILAQQHFEAFIKFFRHLPINIALITGSGCRKFPSKVNTDGWTNIAKSQLLKWVANGEIAVVVGTHALIQKSVKFKHLALAIIDEQHRFGVAQRQKLVSKDDKVPHLLSMTATPIPRTLALTIYGDLDISLLDEMPAGRKSIITKTISPSEREETYEEIRLELEKGRQLYVICPRIDEPDPDKELAIQAKSVKEEAKRLKKEVFPEYDVEILHGKMKTGDKEKTMLDFKAHKFDILVSTSVVEVGVNVENASVIVIEGAERFGLSQLHQLRGRVLRGTHQPYCYVFTESKSKKTEERLEALLNAKNGFELAEYDLKQRGTGSLIGTRQWGVSDIGMEAIQNLKMVEAARHSAEKLVKEDPSFKPYPAIQKRLKSSPSRPIHFE